MRRDGAAVPRSRNSSVPSSRPLQAATYSVLAGSVSARLGEGQNIVGADQLSGAETGVHSRAPVPGMVPLTRWARLPSGSALADELDIGLARLPPYLRQVVRNFSWSKTWSCCQRW